jgi:hypothetical protein
MGRSNVYKLDKVDGFGLVVDRNRVKLRSNRFMIIEHNNMLCVLRLFNSNDVGYLLLLCNYVCGEYNIIDCDVREVLGMGRSSYYRFMRLLRVNGLLDTFKVPNTNVYYVMNPYFCRASSIINRQVLVKFNENICK